MMSVADDCVANVEYTILQYDQIVKHFRVLNRPIGRLNIVYREKLTTLFVHSE